MPYSVGPQAETDYWPEYFWLTKKYGDSGKLHELRKSLWGQKSNPSDFFAWFSTVESHLAEFEPSRKAKETKFLSKPYVSWQNPKIRTQLNTKERFQGLQRALRGKWGCLPT
jgi:hypothetical protein